MEGSWDFRGEIGHQDLHAACYATDPPGAFATWSMDREIIASEMQGTGNPSGYWKRPEEAIAISQCM